MLSLAVMVCCGLATTAQAQAPGWDNWDGSSERGGATPGSGDGHDIGKRVKGSGPGVRTLEGGQPAAERFYDELTVLGNKIKTDAPGVVKQLPGDFKASYRPNSDSGPVIQITRKAPRFNKKYHFPG